MARNSELPPTEWAPALIKTLLTGRATEGMVEDLASIVSDLHPAATRVALRAFAEADLREILPRIDFPTLLLYGEEDVRPPRRVWEPLHSSIPSSKVHLVPEVGHVVDIEAAERFNAEVRGFLRSVSP
jgi:pimeloyl-ACP methyl ester carboxylesterase